MRTKRFLFAAGVSLAMAFTFSCSGDDGSDGKNGADGADGINGLNGSDGADGAKGEPGEQGLQGEQGDKGDSGESCYVSEIEAYYLMICGDKVEAKWPRATCGTVAYDPDKKECNGTILSFTFKDGRDSKEYKAVEIGSQTWMAENLNYSGEDELGSCYDDDKDNCAKYGRLYDWETANTTACPLGWHLPDTTEWNKLLNFAGGSSVAGEKLKAKSGWNNNYISEEYNGNTYTSIQSGNGTDDYGFSALPGGYYNNINTAFYFVETYAYFWTASLREGNSAAYYRSLSYNATNTSSFYFALNYNLYVRCVLD